MSMEFTGERFVPSETGKILYEHVHRYSLALEFVVGKTVIDIGSGEGYGAAILSSAAESVTGVDHDFESIKHAARRYKNPGLGFVIGECDAVPLPGNCFDVVTSFETIEHHDKHEEMLSEIRRLLKPDGVLIISSPNRQSYSDENKYENPYHIKELYYDDFNALLRGQFEHVRIYGQKLAAGSFVFPLSSINVRSLRALTGNVEQVSGQMCPLPSPVYFVAVCSNSRAVEAPQISSVYLDRGGDLLEILESEQADRLDQQIQLNTEFIRKVRAGYDEQITRQADVIAKQTVALNWISLSRTWRIASKFRSFLEGIERWCGCENPILRRILGSRREIFQGRVELAKIGGPGGDYLEIEGWVYSRSGRVAFVEAFLDDMFLGYLRYGVLRADIVASLPEAPRACGYEERIPISSLSIAGRNYLKIRVKDERGNRRIHTAVIPLEQRSMTTTDARRRKKLTETETPIKDKNIEVAVATSEVRAVPTPLADAVVEFQERMRRDPSILDWNSGLNLSEEFPHLAVCAPRSTAESAKMLPYIDSSVDIVVTSSVDMDVLDEARRVAALVLIRTDRNVSTAAESSDEVISVDWNQDQADKLSFPTVSIVIPVFNEVSYTENCLKQLSKTLPRSFRGEIILVDDASSDETPLILENWAQRDERIKLLRNADNCGFIKSCNRGAEVASGETLIFLNNDTLPKEGWLPPLLGILRDKSEAGAVCGKLIYPDGKLQEAGGIVFSDGSACNFGRNDKAANGPLYNHLREVDYGSGALLATRRSLFFECGGFDVRFEPAYYEDADYCFTLRAKGYRVYYQPESVVVHFEGVSAGTDLKAGMKSAQVVNQTKFVEKWKEALQYQPHPPIHYDFATLYTLATRSIVRNGNGK